MTLRHDRLVRVTYVLRDQVKSAPSIFRPLFFEQWWAPCGEYGETIFNLERAIQLGERRIVREADCPRENVFTESQTRIRIG